MALADRPADEQLAIRYCAPLGIPLSVFLGRWTAEDRQAAIDWQAEKDARCSDCGQLFVETLGRENFDRWNAEAADQCDACRALRREVVTGAGQNMSDEDWRAGMRYRLHRDLKPSEPAA